MYMLKCVRVKRFLEFYCGDIYIVICVLIVNYICLYRKDLIIVLFNFIIVFKFIMFII